MGRPSVTDTELGLLRDNHWIIRPPFGQQSENNVKRLGGVMDVSPTTVVVVVLVGTLNYRLDL